MNFLFIGNNFLSHQSMNEWGKHEMMPNKKFSLFCSSTLVLLHDLNKIFHSVIKGINAKLQVIFNEIDIFQLDQNVKTDSFRKFTQAISLNLFYYMCLDFISSPSLKKGTKVFTNWMILLLVAKFKSIAIIFKFFNTGFFITSVDSSYG